MYGQSRAPAYPTFCSQIREGQMFRHGSFDVSCVVVETYNGYVFTRPVDTEGNVSDQIIPYNESVFREKWNLAVSTARV